MSEHPFLEHPLDPAGVKAAEHLLACEEPYCVAVREKMLAGQKAALDERRNTIFALREQVRNLGAGPCA